ncbi:MAG TPA: protein kinase [Thermoanaerobaculia bacterium]|nr:protein kinase [Thermoanaerobaculia bacterium]HQR66045.1 protein kinase [Thermoanaerobaculia bacterium]
MSLSAGARLGPYELQSPLGAGGMGEVWRAWDARLDREVALKLIHPQLAADAERLARFEQEAKAAARLDHPNILVVHDVGTHEGNPYIVSELLEGKSLREVLGTALPPKRAVDIALQIAHGLAAAHEKGIVHRDLKPENVFVKTDGRIKILDFGVAKLTQPSSGPVGTEISTIEMTEPGTVMGTVGYMSPEQVQGKLLDARSDLFSLGVVLYEMLSGKRPFHRGTAPETLTAILREEPPDLTEANKNLSPDLERIVRHCLEKEPERRFQSARDVVFGLEALRGATAEKPVAPMSAGGILLHRHRAGVMAAALVVAVAIVAGIWWKTKGGAGAVGRRLAVLPFENLSGDPGQEFLSDGLTQEMIVQLGRLHPASLSVIARTSVMQYKKTTKPIDQIGRELGVDYVLEGSARREGGRIRITAELIEVRRQAQLWADSFERELSGILALQNDVSQKVARALALKLLPAEQARLASARAVNPEAYEACLKGLHHWYKLTSSELETARSYFEAALAKDPDYALAHTGIALVWLGQAQIGVASPAEAGPKGKAAAERALALDDTIAQTHFVLAGLKAWSEWDYPGAEPEFRRALELNPGYADAHIYYSHFLLILGRHEEAMRHAKRALELDPFNSLFNAMYGVNLTYLRKWDDAAAQARIALKMAPDDVIATGVLWWCYSRKGMYAEAFDAAKRFVRIYEDRDLDEALERGYREAGYRGAMTQGAEALAARFRKSYANPTDVAILNLEAGDKAKALDWLEKGYEVRDQTMPYLDMPLFDPLRSDPRFQALLRKMNLPGN